MKLLIICVACLIIFPDVRGAGVFSRGGSSDVEYLYNIKHQISCDVRNYGASVVRSSCFRRFCVTTAWLSATEYEQIIKKSGIMRITRDEVVSDDRIGHEFRRSQSVVSIPDNIVLWHLDQIDQSGNVPNNVFSPLHTGMGVGVFVMDDGLLTTHEDFEGRAFHGVDVVDNDSDTTPPSSTADHGTHVSGTIIGKISGIAKDSNVTMIRVLDTDGYGTVSDIITGLDYVAEHMDDGNRILSYSIGAEYSVAVQIVQDIMEDLADDGLIIVVSAGNDHRDACGYVPARSSKVITVGSLAFSGEPNYVSSLSSFSNYGDCVDYYTYGSSIISAGIARTDEYALMSGTSMATPIISGMVAVLLEGHGHDKTLSEVKTLLNANQKSIGGMYNLPFLSSNTTSEIMETPVPTAIPDNVVNSVDVLTIIAGVVLFLVILGLCFNCNYY